MTDENKSAESSAAVATEPVHFDGWDESGKPIVTEKTMPKEQESAPAATPAKEAKSENAAESETATTQGKKERKPGEKLSAEERKAQLASEIKALTDEVSNLKAERERSRVTDPKPSATQAEPVKVDAPKRPNPFKWSGTAEEYETALETWDKYQRDQAIAEFQRNTAAEIQKQNLQKQFEEVKAKYPDADTKIKETFEKFADVKFPGVIRAMFDDSECLPELMYVLSDDKTRTNFIETAKTNPGKAIRALAQMEADIRKTQTVQSKDSEAKSDPKPPAEPKPRAPKPLSEVGGRGTADEDALRTAAEAGDFKSFEAEQNRRKFAKAS